MRAENELLLAENARLRAQLEEGHDDGSDTALETTTKYKDVPVCSHNADGLCRPRNAQPEAMSPWRSGVSGWGTSVAWWAAAPLAALGLAGCGGDDSVGETTSPVASGSRTIPSDIGTPRTDTADPSAYLPPAPQSEPIRRRTRSPRPTRVLGEPLVFRVRGSAKPAPENDTPRLRYVLIFRLNWNPEFGSGVPIPGRTRLGNVQLANLRYNDFDYGIFDFDPIAHFDSVSGRGTVDMDRDDCFLGWVRENRPATLRVLDQIPAGGPVDVRIRVVTPKPNGRATFADPLELRAPLHAMRVKPVGSLNLNQVASSEAAARLKKLGCAARILDYAAIP